MKMFENAQVRLIAAVDECMGIGRDGKIPWDLPSDRAFFKFMTFGHPVIMGMNTFVSLAHKPLPGRFCAVLTHHPERYVWRDECLGASDLNELLKVCSQRDEVIYGIGGAQIYRLLLPYTDFIILSRVPGNYCCDAFFPPFDGFVLEKHSVENGIRIDCYNSGRGRSQIY